MWFYAVILPPEKRRKDRDMHFTSGINRPPFESRDGYLQVTSGCSHSKCTFCGYFKDTRFKKSSIEEIEQDIKEILMCFGHPERIFLQGADGFAADYDILMKTAELIHKYVPSVKTIGGYARIDNFTTKSVDEIRNLKDVGYSNPYIGVESGDDVILERVNKGYDAATALEVLQKLDDAGMPVIANFLNGIGGKNYGLSHAIKTAELYAHVDNISMIEVSSLTLVPHTPLFYQKQKGKFVEAGEHERLLEMKEFVSRLKNHTVFLADHVSVPFFTKSRLPEQKEELVKGIQQIIDEMPEEQLRLYRDQNPIM